MKNKSLFKISYPEAILILSILILPLVAATGVSAFEKGCCPGKKIDTLEFDPQRQLPVMPQQVIDRINANQIKQGKLPLTAKSLSTATPLEVEDEVYQLYYCSYNF